METDTMPVCQHGHFEPCRICELETEITALKQEHKRDREWVHHFEVEVPRMRQKLFRMQTVFDAAVEYVETKLSPKYDPTSFEPNFELVNYVRQRGLITADIECDHGQLERHCRICELETKLTALKADNARMQPVFDAAVAHYNYPGYDSKLSLELEDAVRKLHR